MSESPAGHVPQWDMADRMRKALRDAGVGVQEMADYLDVGRNTVSNWINGHNPPPGPAVRLWAMRCGVPLEWLKDGIETSTPTPGGGLSNPRKGRAARHARRVNRRSSLAPSVTMGHLSPIAA